MTRFSTRTAWDTRESDFAGLVRRLRDAGEPPIDLTVSNPTVCGFVYDEAAILGALQSPQALVYDPDPRGMLAAREAVALYYADHDAEVSSGQIVLTTSTSEAYSFLFRLLCNAGDAVLTGQPGYPLFDFLAGMEQIVLVNYPLFYDFGWWIDFAELERRITPGTRAIVLVHPNNPTGHATRRAERTRIEDLCVHHGLSLIVDEVFLDYPIDSEEGNAGIESFACGPHRCPTFVVSGISKVCALPQMKAGWIAAFGPKVERREALERLEVIADTFLSMNAPVQLALPKWLEQRTSLSSQIIRRVEQNLHLLTRATACGVEHLRVEAGWNAIVRLPAHLTGSDGSDASTTLLRGRGLLIHPGSFYGLAGSNLAVVSLIVPARDFELAMERLCTDGNELQARTC